MLRGGRTTSEQTTRAPERERRVIGRYVVQEYTARRFIAETRNRPNVALGVMWGAWVIVAALVAPWQSGTRLLTAAISALVMVGVSLLVVRFYPRRTQVVVDVETGECRVEHIYSLPHMRRELRISLAEVDKVRCRRRVWRDRPDVEAIRWRVELVGRDGRVWPMADGTQQEPMRELARLIAEVAGRPLDVEP